MKRTIGITHRVKRTVEGEARPTLVVIKEEDGEEKEYKLAEEQDELDFVLGRFPSKWRAVEEDEDFSGILPWHIKRDKKTKKPERVPAEYEGLKQGDIIVMCLGGSGDRLAFATYRHLKRINGKVLRITPYLLKESREDEKKDKDHSLLIKLFAEKPEIFQEMVDRDLDLIRVKEAFLARQDAMKARIACGNRLRQRFIGEIFISNEGGYSEGSLEDEYDGAEANDSVYQGLLKEEAGRDLEFKKFTRQLAVWQKVFEPINGVGETIAAGLIVAIGDIRRFQTDTKLKAFAGLHVLNEDFEKMPIGTKREDGDGLFVRRRHGTVCNWHPGLRQALYLLGDQFNRRPDSTWGKKLREYKTKFREKHPEPIKGENGKLKYTDAHIHKMAIWRTLTKFVEWLFKEWKRAEAEKENKKAA